MNSVSLSFAAPDVESFTKALDALQAHSIACSASVLLPAPTIPATPPKPATANARGHYEGMLWDKGRRVRYTEGLQATWGSKEAYCQSLLETEFPELMPSLADTLNLTVPVAEYSAPDTIDPDDI